MKKKAVLNIILSIVLLTFFLGACHNPFLGDQNLAPGKNQHIIPELPVYETVVPPQNLTATGGKLDQIDLNWSFVPVAFSYNLYRSTEKDHSYILLKSQISERSFTDDGSLFSLKSGMIYYYKVAAVNKDGVESNLSFPVEGYCYLSSGAITYPALFTVSNGDFTDQIVLKWDKVQGAFGYSIRRATSIDGEYKILNDSIPKDQTEYIDHDQLEIGKTYFYQIQTFSESEKSSFSASVEGSLANAAIPVPENLTASTTFDKEVQLNWVCSGCERFIVYRSEKADSEFVQIAEVTNNSYQDQLEGVAIKEKPYFYRVQGFKENQKGAVSEVQKGHIVIEAPKIQLKDKDGQFVGQHHELKCDLSKNEIYNEADFGWKVIDNVDGEISVYCYSEGTIDPGVPGIYTLTYKVADKAGNKATATRVIKVGRSPLSEKSFTLSEKYPLTGKPFTLRLLGVTPSNANVALGETIQWDATYKKLAEDAVSVPLTLSEGAYQLAVNEFGKILVTLTLSNEFGSITVSNEIEIYQDLNPFQNDFSDGFGSITADVAIAINPKEGFKVTKNITSDYAYGGALYKLEQILEVSEGAFIMSNTEHSTDVLWLGDKKETCVRLRTANIHLVAGTTYQVAVDITRSDRAKANVEVSLGGQSVAAPLKAGTHSVTLTLTPTETIDSPLFITKGIWKEDISQADVITHGDQIEVKVDNIVISYAQ